MRHLFVLACLLIPPLLQTAAAHATEPAESAEQLLAKGAALRKSGDNLGALRAFQAAQDKTPSARALAQVAIAEAALDRWVEAEDHLTQALQMPSPWMDKNRSVLEQTLQTMRTHTTELVVSGPAGATVTVADRVVGSLPLVNPIRVNEGSLAVKVEAPGRKPFTQMVPAQGGSRVIVTASLDPLPEAIPLPSSPVVSAPILGGGGDDSAGDGSTWRRWVGAGLLTVGIAAVAWGVVWVAVDGNKSGSDVYNTRTPGWVLTATGAAASGAGGYLLYTSRQTKTSVSLAPMGIIGRF
jgi:hypothetical protein